MRKVFLYILLFATASCNWVDRDLFPSEKKRKVLSLSAMKGVTGVDGPLKTDSAVLHRKIKSVLKKAKAEDYNTQYALLADLGLHSGTKRFYIINLKNKTIITSGLVTHGSSTTYLENGKRQYSNTEGSLCSSLGMYKIGLPYRGKFGLAYKLYGLNKENSNAYARAVVLHSHTCVPDAETVNSICQSWGCPTVSPTFLETLSKYIDASEKPMLLYLFDSSR